MKVIISLLLALFLVACGDNKSNSSASKEAVPVSNVNTSTTQQAVSKVKKMASTAVDTTEKAFVKTKKVASDVSTKVVAKTKEVSAKVTKKVKETLAIKPSKTGATIFKACASCHGQKAEKKALGKSEIIAGWSSSKIQTALKAYKAGTRNKYGMGVLMKGQASKLSDADIKTVADYISAL